jgi:hypothetical protein
MEDVTFDRDLRARSPDFGGLCSPAMTRPRHVVCVLGEWKSFDDVERIVREVGGEGFQLDDDYSMLGADPRMARAFEASRDRVTPSFTDEDLAAIKAHVAVAYVLSPPMDRDAAQAISGRMLATTAALLEAGGTAAKGESAGIAHGRARWLGLAERYARGDALTRAAVLSAAWVRRPLGDDDRGVFYSCGMHLLGEPDVELPDTLESLEAVTWMDALCIYLLAEKRADDERGLRDGETFRPTEEHDRRVLRHRACDRYEEDDFFWNPYGYWTLGAP